MSSFYACVTDSINPPTVELSGLCSETVVCGLGGMGVRQKCRVMMLVIITAVVHEKRQHPVLGSNSLRCI